MHFRLGHDTILMRLSGIFRDQGENILYSPRAFITVLPRMFEALDNYFYLCAAVDLFICISTFQIMI